MRRLASVADDPVVLLIDKAGKNLGHKVRPAFHAVRRTLEDADPDGWRP